MIFLCVGLAIRPFFSKLEANWLAISLSENSTPIKRPLPLTYLTMSLLLRIAVNLFFRCLPIT